MLIFKISFEKKRRDDLEVSRQLKTAKRNRTTEFVEKNGDRQLCVTFDQNVKNAISAEFGILAASHPDSWFLRTKSVIGTFSQTVRARIF